MARLTVVAAVIGIAVAVLAGRYYLTSPDGKEIFIKENCNKCHSLRGEGLGVIDLTGVVKARGRQYVRDQITRPRTHDPNPGMPSFAYLSGREVNALIDYIEGK